MNVGTRVAVLISQIVGFGASAIEEDHNKAYS